MDSPHLVGVGFLLLAVAAPHPNIAMAIDCPAERTHDSSPGKTKVSVYCCKDCAVSACEDHSFKGFAKIAETQKETFSNGIIELVTREERILMCFQQANTIPEGIYAIFWVKPEGVGHACGNPNSTAFLVNGRADISTEKKRICCEAETNIWESNTTLKCYTEKSGAQTGKPTAYTTCNPEFPTNNKSSFVISLTLLLLPVLCAAVTIRYFYRQHQYRQGGSNGNSLSEIQFPGEIPDRRAAVQLPLQRRVPAQETDGHPGIG